MTVRVEVGKEDHLEEYEVILRKAFAPYVAKLGRKQSPQAYEWLPEAVSEQRVLQAEIDDELVGVAIYQDLGLVRNVDQVAVVPMKQGQGIGSALLHRIETDAAKALVQELSLDTAEIMTDLIRLYEGHGFKIVRRGQPTHGRDGHMRVYMTKLLSEVD